MKKLKILALLVVPVIIFYYLTTSNRDIKPVNFPSNLSIEGFKFPEDSTTIYAWLDSQDTTKIVNHAWGIWAGLTEPTDQKYNGQTLLVFETWRGVQELAALSAQGKTSESEPKKERTELSVPKQFLHGRLLANGPKPIDTSFVVLETVSYDPSAAYFATSNKLFNQSVLEGYKVKDGMGKIPEFPNTGITTKPTYYAKTHLLCRCS